MEEPPPFEFVVFLFLVGSLAVFRATELWVIDKGPFGMFEKIRNGACRTPVICEILTCFYCMSGWASLLYSIWIWAFLPMAGWLFPVWWFGVWGGASLTYRSIRQRNCP